MTDRLLVRYRHPELGLGLGMGLNGGMPQFNPNSLFASGEQGVWFEPSPATCFANVEMTTPATVGDMVAAMRDLSGHNNHAFQTAVPSRPILRQHVIPGAYSLEWDGLDDFLVTAPIDFSASDKIALWACVRKLTDASAAGSIVELSSNADLNNGTFNLRGPQLSGANYQMQSKGSSSSTATSATIYPSPHSAILTGIGDIGGDSTILRVNGARAAAAGTDQGAGKFGNYPIFVGRKGGTVFPFKGHSGPLIIRGGRTSSDQIAAAEQYLNGIWKSL